MGMDGQVALRPPSEDDLAAAHDRVLSAGAVLVEEHVSPRPGPAGEPIPWRVYRDPAGHPFCLVVR